MNGLATDVDEQGVVSTDGIGSPFNFNDKTSGSEYYYGSNLVRTLDSGNQEHFCQDIDS